MVASRHARRLGFTLLELLVVICLVAVLLSVAFDRMLRYMELAERAAMETTVGAMKSALHLRIGSIYATGGRAAVGGLAAENPFDWLAQRPDQYVGTLFDPKLEEVAPGAWYFDRASRQAVYRPQRTRYLVRPRPGEDPRIRFQIVIQLADDGSPAGLRGLSGADLAPVAPYLWQAGETLNGT